jgi:hypothetical protein
LTKWIAVLLAAAILAAILWGVSELHYDNCVEAAKASHGGDPFVNVPERVAGCSRLPW